MQSNSKSGWPYGTNDHHASSRNCLAQQPPRCLILLKPLPLQLHGSSSRTRFEPELWRSTSFPRLPSLPVCWLWWCFCPHSEPCTSTSNISVAIDRATRHTMCITMRIREYLFQCHWKSLSGPQFVLGSIRCHRCVRINTIKPVGVIFRMQNATAN